MFTQAVGMTASDWSVSNAVKTRQNDLIFTADYKIKIILRLKAKRLFLVRIFPSETAIIVLLVKYPAIVRSGPTVVDKKRGKFGKMSLRRCVKSRRHFENNVEKKQKKCLGRCFDSRL